MVTTPWSRRRERRLAQLEVYRATRRMVAEDVAVLGAQLAELRDETLDSGAQDDLRQALEADERARSALSDAERLEDAAAVLAVVPEVQDARWHRACVLARVGGSTLPTRRGECFLNPQHGPGAAEVTWQPPRADPREILVCAACRDRLAAGAAPDVRQVRVGDRWVPWWSTGGNLVEATRSRRYGVRNGRGEAAGPDVMEVSARVRPDGTWVP